MIIWGVVGGRGGLAEDIRRSCRGWGEMRCPVPSLPQPPSFLRHFNIRYPSSELFSMTRKKEIDCVFKSYLEPTKDALFQNGLRRLGALGGKSWTYTIISSHYAWCYSCCHVGYYKANCQLVSLRAKTKLLCLQEYEACSSLPPPPPTLQKAQAPPWDTHTFGRDIGRHGGRNHLAGFLRHPLVIFRKKKA